MPTDGIAKDGDITPDVMRMHYPELGLHLTAQEETFVQMRMRGLNPIASARAAGFKTPTKAARDLALRPEIDEAIAYFREQAKLLAVHAGAIEFTKDDATLLYLQAHAKAGTATEEIKAVDSLVKLHGLAAPEKKQVEITSREQLGGMSDEELQKLAGRTFNLSPDDYAQIEDAALDDD